MFDNIGPALGGAGQGLQRLWLDGPPVLLVLTGEGLLRRAAVIVEQKVLAHADLLDEHVIVDREALGTHGAVQLKDRELGQRNVALDESLGGGAFFANEEARDVEAAEERGGFIADKAAFLIREDIARWTPQADPQIEQRLDKIGPLLAREVASSFPANGLIDEEHEGLVEQEKEIVLHNLVEVRGEVPLDLWPVQLRLELQAMRAVTRNVNAFENDVPGQEHGREELEHLVRGGVPEALVKSHEKTPSFGFVLCSKLPRKVSQVEVGLVASEDTLVHTDDVVGSGEWFAFM